MRNFKYKLLVLCSSLLIAQTLNAKMTMCYKKGWDSPSTITKTKMQGGECNGLYSITEMKDKGWYIKDIKIESTKQGMSYTYVLSDVKEKTRANYSYKSKENQVINIPSFNIKYLQVNNVKNSTAVIKTGNLQVGQSGIITHTYEDKKSVILANAIVINSNSKTSQIKFLPFNDLEQKAIPTTKKAVKNGDTFILNYLYNASILIAPNIESFKKIRNIFIKHNFLHSDILATYLKNDGKEVPSKEILQRFTKKQNVGTIFVALDNKVYVIDSKSFKIIDSYSLNFDTTNQQMPFYTRIDSLDTYVWDIDFNVDFIKDIYNSVKDHILDEDEQKELAKEKRKNELDMTSYTNYYNGLLGL